MATVREHYDGHLGPVYGWMLGDFEAAVAARAGEHGALHGESTVAVTDLLHERRDASWDFRASSYTKLRIAPSFVEGSLRESGLTVRRERGARGMVAIVGKRV